MGYGEMVNAVPQGNEKHALCYAKQVITTA